MHHFQGVYLSGVANYFVNARQTDTGDFLESEVFLEKYGDSIAQRTTDTYVLRRTATSKPKNMAKSQNAKKQTKKLPAKTPKQKKAAKKAKK